MPAAMVNFNSVCVRGFVCEEQARACIRAEKPNATDIFKLRRLQTCNRSKKTNQTKYFPRGCSRERVKKVPEPNTHLSPLDKLERRTRERRKKPRERDDKQEKRGKKKSGGCLATLCYAESNLFHLDKASSSKVAEEHDPSDLGLTPLYNLSPGPLPSPPPCSRLTSRGGGGRRATKSHAESGRSVVVERAKSSS